MRHASGLADQDLHVLISNLSTRATKRTKAFAKIPKVLWWKTHQDSWSVGVPLEHNANPSVFLCARGADPFLPRKRNTQSKPPGGHEVEATMGFRCRAANRKDGIVHVKLQAPFASRQEGL